MLTCNFNLGVYSLAQRGEVLGRLNTPGRFSVFANRQNSLADILFWKPIFLFGGFNLRWKCQIIREIYLCVFINGGECCGHCEASQKAGYDIGVERSKAHHTWPH